MKLSNNSRREWLKKGVLSVGALALTPHDIWSHRVKIAREHKLPFVFEASTFSEYTPPVIPDLDSLKARLLWNENPYGPSPKAAEAFKNAVEKGNHYSWNTLNALIQKIADKEGVNINQIMMGPGSSDLLEKTALLHFMKGGNIVTGDPCYMSLVHVATATGGKWKPIKLTSRYEHDLKAMEKAIDSETKMVYITNPNNPTATTTPAKKLYEFCERVSEKVPVFIDEAYLELSENGLQDSMAPLVAKGKNVFVSRTFSKIHGMAGLRIGYMLGNEEELKKINAITRGGMGITGPSIMAASASMDDSDFLSMCKMKIKETREYTFNLLKSKNIPYMPSETNFIIFPVDMEGDEFLQKIYDRKIAVRMFKFWDKNWCRVSMGTMDEMKLFAEAINEIIV
ncbi:pyridoxal phosphate-dependent aminotransferase [Abyssalbus ytuae]|uniref:Histidinol-phosphate aminotransferase family protein n=1 Tax=Abyssalbus ytuae TaxID=2926907 RepID=A0A9E6ZNN7_9FLAO|nr:histidinol-phosphate transaminase [Abyssalbus ytuae]UOB19232.1 histidinol-phosphate aminotransferase family protein [Abyssalbus ytuae]